MDATRTRVLTADEYYREQPTDRPSELVRGEVRLVTPASGPHGLLALRLAELLTAHARAHGGAWVFGDNTGFRLPIPGARRDTVRSPDAAVVTFARLPAGLPARGFLPCAPDLVVEVRSPDDAPGELAERMADYRAAGTTCLWVFDLPARTAEVHVAAAHRSMLVADRPGVVLDGAPVLPGFTLDLGALFDEVERWARGAAAPPASAG